MLGLPAFERPGSARRRSSVRAVMALALTLCCTTAVDALAGGPGDEGRENMTTEIMPGAGGLTEAVAAARGGDWQPLNAVSAEPEAIVAALAPLAEDPDAGLRLGLVQYLAGLGDSAAAPLLVRLLGDAEPEVQSRAAAALYDLPLPGAALDAEPGAAEALMAAASDRPLTAAELLLLGYVEDPGAEAMLRGVDAGAAVKLRPWHRPVPATLAGDVALSRRGDAAARDRLLQRQPDGPTEELVFLLSVLRDVDAPPVLHHLAALTLGDDRTIDLGVPSGASPKRRVCDLAVDAFTARLDLDLPFALDPAGRYDEAQRQAVRDAIRGSIPR
ncbi:HEAT repeat domain-containing protein [uncultured Rhodospira sp.]|uniref:HEAT repeat domain-containing protein n=1 Tax=uncultured Rhodospira sp. TaxID=1936189 RepID=UPI002639697E|nr:HEAT repeat domain-containing protein [uncultured Rhodospira sp.]